MPAPKKTLTGEKAPKKTRKDYEEATAEKLRPFIVAEQLADQADGSVTADKKLLDGSNPDAYQNQWAEVIATHLAAERQFAIWMKNPQDLATITLSKEWLGAIRLRGRSVKSRDIPDWHKSWFSAKGHRMEILKRAKEIYEAAFPDLTASSIANTTTATLKNDKAAQKNRNLLFRLQTSRQQLVLLVKSCTDTELALATANTAFGARLVSSEVSPDILEAAEELKELEDCKAAVRSKLKDWTLNRRGIAMLDELLELVPSHKVHGDLFKLPSEPELDFDDASAGDQPDKDQTDEASADPPSLLEDAVDLSGQIEFNCVPQEDGTPGQEPFRNLHDDGVFTTRTVTLAKKDLVALQVSGYEMRDRASALLEAGQLRSADRESAQWLEELAANVDRGKFKLTFEAFEGVTQRPQKCRKASRDHTMWINPRYWFDVVKDNIYHVRGIVAAMVDQQMIEQDGSFPALELQQTLRRMWALLALCYGLWTEPALLCTVMDQLLEELADLIVGHKDPAFNTIRMQSMISALQSRSNEEARAITKMKPDDYDLTRLNKEHKAREWFAEIAKFFRGAVMMAVGASLPFYGDKNKDQLKAWYESLLELSSKCGHRTCAEQLQVVVKEQVKTQRYSLSVAVEDARMGFPEQRCFLSTNRRMAYPCFYHFIAAVRYNAALGPFFHYFAHLWHPACRPFRGKQTLMEDINFVKEKLDEDAMYD